MPLPPLDEYDATIAQEQLGESAPEPNGRDAEQQLPQATCALHAPPPEPIEWTVEDLWTKPDIGLIVGDGGSFKSSAALHMAVEIACGGFVFERFRVPIARPVLVVSAEDPPSVIMMRLEAFIRGHGRDRTEVLSNIHYLAQTETSLSDPRWRRHLAEEVMRLDVGFLILDPLAELLGVDENNNSEVRPLIKYFRFLANLTGAAIAIVHHAGKASAEKRQVDRIRGASAVASASRVIHFFDFQKKDVVVENLKLSRAERLEPFLVNRHIEHEQGNRAMWTKARLTYQSARDALVLKAEAWLLEELTRALPERMNTTALRKAAEGKHAVEHLSQAIDQLERKGRIEYLEGPRHSKLWGLPGHRPPTLALDET